MGLAAVGLHLALLMAIELLPQEQSHLWGPFTLRSYVIPFVLMVIPVVTWMCALLLCLAGFLCCVPSIFRIAKQMASELLHARCVPFAESLEGPRVPVFRSFHQDRIAQPRIGKWSFRTGGLRDLTPAATWQLHLCALV